MFIQKYIAITSLAWNKCFIQNVPNKTLCNVFANISANTYSREPSRLSTELSWQEVSNGMRLDFLRYLVPEKIDILGEILTLIERTITPLQVHEFWIAFKHSWILVWTLLRSNLSSLCGVFLILNVLQRYAFHFLYIDFRHFVWVVKKIRTLNRQMFASLYTIVL